MTSPFRQTDHNIHIPSTQQFLFTVLCINRRYFGKKTITITIFHEIKRLPQKLAIFNICLISLYPPPLQLFLAPTSARKAMSETLLPRMFSCNVTERGTKEKFILTELRTNIHGNNHRVHFIRHVYGAKKNRYTTRHMPTKSR